MARPLIFPLLLILVLFAGCVRDGTIPVIPPVPQPPQQPSPQPQPAPSSSPLSTEISLDEITPPSLSFLEGIGTSLVQNTQCAATVDASEVQLERGLPPVFGVPYGSQNVSIVGNTTGSFGGIPVNITVAKVDNKTVYIFNVTLGNTTVGVISDNFTIMHPANMSGVDILKANVTRVANLTTARQPTNFSCGPTAGGSIIEFYNRTFPSVMGGNNLSSIIANLTSRMNTTENGTGIGGVIGGLSGQLNATGKAANFTIGVYVNASSTQNVTITINRTARLTVNNTGGPETNMSVPITIPVNSTIPMNVSLGGGVSFPAKLNITGNFTVTVNVTIPANFSGTTNISIGIERNVTAGITYLNTSINGVNASIKNKNINITGLIGEFITQDEMVFIGIDLEGGPGHALALDDLSSTPGPNGKYHISFMDPATGLIYVSEISPDGTFDYLGKKAKITYFVSLSPK